MTALAWGWRFLKPQNPLLPGNHGINYYHVLISGQVIIFSVIIVSCSDDALAFDPNELT